jgi:very-short-patch-repair endonuclease
MSDSPAARPPPREIGRLQPSELAANRSKDLRRRMTPPERILWSKLRRAQLGGLEFRRQHALGPYIADFFCDDARLVIELDGITHFYQPTPHDRIRNDWMRERGLEVLRFHASGVSSNLAWLLGEILAAAQRRVGELEPVSAAKLARRRRNVVSDVQRPLRQPQSRLTPPPPKRGGGCSDGTPSV